MVYSESDCVQLIASLRALGFVDQHHFIQSLQTTRTVDLNTYDDFELTPLRLAIQKQDIGAIKTLKRLVPNHKHLSSYDSAIIGEVNSNKKNKLKSISLPTHHELIYCVQALYSIEPDIVDGGMCFGLSHMRRQAFFSKEIDVFNRRQKNIKTNLWPIIKNTMDEVTNSGIDRKADIKKYVNAVRLKLKDKFPYRIWHDMYEFFDGVILYLNPGKFEPIFEFWKTLLQDPLPAEPMLRPVKMDTSVPSDVFSGQYSKDTLPTYFKCLERLFKNLNFAVSLEISTGLHVYSIEYRDGKWTYIDSNHPDDSEKKCDSNEISKLLLTNYPEPLIFATRPFISPDKLQQFNIGMSKLKKNTEWTGIHGNLNSKQVSQKNSNGCSLLYVSSSCGDSKTVRRCIATKNTIILNEAVNDFTPLLMASENGHTKVVKELIDALKDKEAINKTSSEGATAVYLAAQYGYVDVVKEFIKVLKDEKSINIPKNDGVTPFFSAVERGHHEVVKEFIQAFNNKNILQQKNNNGHTPLYIAASNGHFKLVKEFVTILDDNRINETFKGFTPLMVAAENGHVKCVSEIINGLKNKKSIYQVEPGGATALYIAAQNGHLDVVTVIIQALNDEALIDLPRKDGYTPFFIAVENGHLDVVKKFLDVLSNKLIHQKKMGKTLLEVAVEAGRKEIVEELFKRDLVNISQLYQASRNLLDLAKSENQTDIYNQLFQMQQNHRKMLLTEILNKYRNHNFHIHFGGKSVAFKNNQGKTINHRFPKKEHKLFTDINEILKQDITDDIYKNILIKIDVMLNAKKTKKSHRMFGKASDNMSFNNNMLKFIETDLAIMNNLPKLVAPSP